MMETWKREFCEVQSGPEWKSGDKGGAKELELAKMDTLIMQVSKMSRSVAEVREGCLCVEEYITTEENEQRKLESELKSFTINPMTRHQHSVTESNLQASTELIRDHTEGEERENEILKKELDILVKRLVNVKESKRTKLSDIKDHYGNQLMDKEESEQQRKVVEFKHKKNALTTKIQNLKQENIKQIQTEWSSFKEIVINMAKLSNMIRNKSKTVQQYKASVQMLQTSVHSKNHVENVSDARRLVVDSKQTSANYLSSSLQNPEHDHAAPETSSYTSFSSLQGQDQPQVKHSFSTSLSLLKLPSTKFGDKKTSNYTWSIQDGGGKINPSQSEVCSQTINSLSHSQAQTINTSLLFKKKSQITTNNVPNFSSLNCNHNPEKSKHQIYDKIPGTKNISHPQDSTNYLIDSNSFSSESLSPATEASASQDAGGSSFISQITKELSPSRETSSSSPQVYRGLEMTPKKFKGVKDPTVNPRGLSRGYELHHIKFTGVAAPCLLPRHTRPPLSSKGIGKPYSRDLSIHPQASFQTLSEKYTDSPNAEPSGFPLSAKHVTYKRKSQECLTSTDCLEERPTALSKDTNDNCHYLKKPVPMDTSPGSFSGPSSNNVPSTEDGATHRGILPIHMEIDNHESLKANNTDPSPREPTETCQSLSVASLKSQEYSFFSGKGNIITPENGNGRNNNNSNSRPFPPKITLQSKTASSSTPFIHSISKENKTKYLGMKPLQHKQHPLTPTADTNHHMQELSSNTLALPGNDNEGNIQFHQFGSSIAESSVPVCSRTSGSNNLFTLQNGANSRTDNTTCNLFNFNLGSDVEVTEPSDSSFFSSFFDSSSDANNTNDTPGFHLF